LAVSVEYTWKQAALRIRTVKQGEIEIRKLETTSDVKELTRI